VAGLARVQEEGGRSRAGQGGGNLVADMTRLAHAGHHYLATTAQHHLARLRTPRQVLVESINGLFFMSSTARALRRKSNSSDTFSGFTDIKAQLRAEICCGIIKSLPR
jgi:hypothetical protein